MLEDQALNYLQQHAESAGVSEQAMESARIAATRGSDSSGALEQLLKIMGQEQVAWLGLGLGLGLGFALTRTPTPTLTTNPT